MKKGVVRCFLKIQRLVIWWRSGILYLTPTRYTVTTRMILQLWAIVWAILMFHQLCGQSHKTVSITHNFRREEKGEPKRNEPRSVCLPAKHLTARPHRLTPQWHGGTFSFRLSYVLSSGTCRVEREPHRQHVFRALFRACA